MNTTGHLLRLTTFGESHGPALGAVIDGCPPGLLLDEALIQVDLDRRRPGQGAHTTPRRESDRVEILSGVFEGETTGAPIGLLIRNHDADPGAYAPLKGVYRPGHADFSYHARFGRRDWRGGGRASARETACRVAGGAIARAILAREGVEVLAWVEALARVTATVDPLTVTRAQIEADPLRCPDPEARIAMAAALDEARAARDTVGGIVGCVARGVPPGWGAPIFDRLEADLAKACLSIPACKGFELGDGFAGSQGRGSTHNDPFKMTPQGPRVAGLKGGGIDGGISNGAPILFRCAFKPVSSHGQAQKTYDLSGAPVEITVEGRHDPTVLPRAAPVVEAAALLTLADHLLRTRALGRAGP
ncbi:chorismate synthase [Myxococcota bacterium]|nr:chorismate synthase [Myxococcota bacterium]